MLRSESGIKRELRRIKQEQKRNDLDERNRGELYGAMQAFEWALQNNAMAPHKIVPTRRPGI